MRICLGSLSAGHGHKLCLHVQSSGAQMYGLMARRYQKRASWAICVFLAGAVLLFIGMLGAAVALDLFEADAGSSTGKLSKNLRHTALLSHDNIVVHRGIH